MSERVQICVPSLYGSADSTFWVPFAAMFRAATCDVGVLTAERLPIEMARNEFVKVFIQDPKKATHLLFIDDDTVPPKFAIDRLLAHDVDIVNGLTCRRKPPFDPCVYRFDANVGKHKTVDIFRKGLIEVDAVGMACTLIKREVFMRMLELPEINAKSPKWFEWTASGEDITFCVRAKKAGFKVFCDTDLICDHYGPRMIINEAAWIEAKKREAQP